MLTHQTAKPCSDVEVTYKVGIKDKRHWLRLVFFDILCA